MAASQRSWEEARRAEDMIGAEMDDDIVASTVRGDVRGMLKLRGLHTRLYMRMHSIVPQILCQLIPSPTTSSDPGIHPCLSSTVTHTVTAPITLVLRH